MARDQSVRNRIIAYLAEHGAVEDSGGKATSVLKKAIAYEGTDAGFTQVVAAMAKAGLLARQIKGKRTYRISNSGTGAPAALSTVASAAEGPLDYEELAATLLAQVTRLAATPADASESSSWARRRLEQLEARNASLQRDVARANAETEAVAAERDILKNQLEAAEHNLSLLTDRLQEPRRPQHGRAAERLGPDEQTLLDQLRHRRPQRATTSERAI